MSSGLLIINADDVGRCRAETDIAVALFREQRLTSGTFMMFMEDTERAVGLAREHGMGTGLHLNLSQAYNGRAPSAAARKAHERIVRFMRRSKFAVLLYHPGLRAAFRDVFRSQAEEYERLFGQAPRHVDGHQHRHLCANMLWEAVIPRGCSVRRNFSFFPGDKSRINRAYRRWVDGRLARWYRLTDYFFSLGECLRGRRVGVPAQLAREHPVEVMTHPIHPEEAAFLRGPEFADRVTGVQMGNYGSI
jgi:chitin disaccharide deacetylase